MRNTWGAEGQWGMIGMRNGEWKDATFKLPYSAFRIHKFRICDSIVVCLGRHDIALHSAPRRRFHNPLLRRLSP